MSSIKVDTRTKVTIDGKDAIVVKPTTSTPISKKEINKVTVSPRTYQIVSQDVYTIKRNSDLEPWFQDQLDNAISSSSLSSDLDDLDQRFRFFDDGITKRIGDVETEQGKMSYDISVLKTSSTEYSAGIQRLDITKVTPEQAEAIARTTIGAWQNNGDGGAWFDSKISTVSNVAYSAASSASTLSASLKSQSDRLSAIAGDIGILQKQVDGKVESWFSTEKPVNTDGSIREDVFPYSDWTTDNDKAIHTGDTYIHYELDVDGNKVILGTYRFTYDTDAQTYSWDIFSDDIATEAYTRALQAQDTADGKIVTFYQDYPPVIGENSLGDLWIDSTDNKNLMYRCSGIPLAWIPVRDKDIEASVKRLDEATVTVDGVARARSSLLVEAGNAAAGFIVAADDSPTGTPTSSFKIFANKFEVANSEGDGYSPFVVEDGKIKFTGDVSFASVKTSYLDNDSFADSEAFDELKIYAETTNSTLEEAAKEITAVSLVASTASSLASETSDSLADTDKALNELSGTVGDISEAVTALEKQVDGVVETFFSDTIPTDGDTSRPNINVSPYKDWILPEDTRAIHSGDTVVYYEVVDGEKRFVADYRFAKLSSPTNETDELGYGFFKVSNSRADEAYQLALDLESTVDGKISTFYRENDTDTLPTYNDGRRDGDILIIKYVEGVEKNYQYIFKATNEAETEGNWVNIDKTTVSIAEEINEAADRSETLISGNAIQTNSLKANRLEAGSDGYTVWTGGVLVSQTYVNSGGTPAGNIVGTPNGFRLSANAAGTREDPDIYGAYIRGATISGSSMDFNTLRIYADGYPNNFGKAYVIENMPNVSPRPSQIISTSSIYYGPSYGVGFETNRICSTNSIVKIYCHYYTQTKDPASYLQRSIDGGTFITISSLPQFTYGVAGPFIHLDDIPSNCNTIQYRLVINTNGSTYLKLDIFTLEIYNT